MNDDLIAGQITDTLYMLHPVLRRKGLTERIRDKGATTETEWTAKNEIGAQDTLGREQTMKIEKKQDNKADPEMMDECKNPTKSVFDNVETIAEIMGKAENMLGIALDKSLYYVKKEFLTISMRSIENAIVEFPSLKEHIKGIAMKDSEKGAYASTDFLRSTITLNTYYYHRNNHERYTDSLNEHLGSRWFAVPTVKGTMYHEIGHVLHRMYMEKLYPDSLRMQFSESNNIAEEIVAEAAEQVSRLPGYKGIREEEIREDLSGYARTRFKETVAEAVSDYLENGKKAKPISIKIVDKIREMVSQ